MEGFISDWRGSHGFVVSGRQVFFLHANQIVDGPAEPRPGQRVTFEPAVRSKGSKYVLALKATIDD